MAGFEPTTLGFGDQRSTIGATLLHKYLYHISITYAYDKAKDKNYSTISKIFPREIVNPPSLNANCQPISTGIY